jgi:hypothetical protein
MKVIPLLTVIVPDEGSSTFGYLPHFYVGLYIVEIVLVLNTAEIVLD